MRHLPDLKSKRRSPALTRWIAALLMAGLVPTLCAQSPQTNLTLASEQGVAVSAGKLDDAISLSPGDAISFRIVEDRDEARRLTVTDTGEIEVPYIGRIKAGRKTCAALAEEAKRLLEKDYYYQATVVIGIDSLRKKTIGKAYLTGQIRNPGPVDLVEEEALTVSAAILKAGGFSDFADKRRIKVMRQNSASNAVETLYVDVIDIWEKGRKEKDLQVKPGDQIFVSSKLINF